MRQSTAQIDHAILDVAAGLFAVHGFANTSVQQIADAVGYSKPGLLHRFGSKSALHEAVLSEVSDTAQELLGHAVATSDQPDQVTGVLDLLTRRALARPGMVQLMLRAFEPAGREHGTEAVQEAGARLVEALDHPVGSPAERLRLVLALQVIVHAATTQSSPVDADLHVDPEELVPLLVALATGVLGPGYR